MKKLLLSLVFFWFLRLPVFASEGTAELFNVVGEDARCWVASVLMGNYEYKALVSCRDLLYPGGTEVYKYSLWIQPIANKNPIKVGSLGTGKMEFANKEAF